MAGSSYLFYYADDIMTRIEHHRPQVTRSTTLPKHTMHEHDSYDIIIVGYSKHGQRLSRALSRYFTILVLEHDPYIANHADVPPNVTVLHADVTENEIRKEVEQYHARFVIVTSSEFDVNLSVHHYNKDLDRYTIARAQSEEDALRLYDQGVDIVHVIHDQAVNDTVDMILRRDDLLLKDRNISHRSYLTEYVQKDIFQLFNSPTT
ncbi:MAG: NAD-binding protein [Candidatus Peribacteria bacterium]|nr:MAG: NAD-binding protein [Candidatus Peribacteria bacterium]